MSLDDFNTLALGDEPHNLIDCLHLDAVAVAQQIYGFNGDNERQVHATNGAYAFPDPVRLAHEAVAANEFIASTSVMQPNDILLIAVNSTVSMKAISQSAPHAPAFQVENEERRFNNIFAMADVLAAQNPTKTIVLASYDEETPAAFYATLAQEGVNLTSIYKYGNYGATQTGPTIPGQEHFPYVFSLDLKSGEKALCEDVTATGNNSRVARIDLTQTMPPFLTVGRRSVTALTEDAQLLIDLLEARKASVAGAPVPKQP